MKGLELDSLPEQAPIHLTRALREAKSAIETAEQMYKAYRESYAEAAGRVIRYNNLVLEYRGQLKLFDEKP